MAGSEGQTLSEAARNTAISQMINFGSEIMGGDINRVAVKVGAKAVGMLPKKAQADLRSSFAGKLYQESQAAARLAKPRVTEAQGLPAVPGLRTWIGAAVRPRTGFLTQAGVHNYVSELAEEQLAMALNEGFGVDLTPEQLQDPLLQRLGRAFVPTTDDAVATMGVLAIPGLVHGVMYFIRLAHSRGLSSWMQCVSPSSSRHPGTRYTQYPSSLCRSSETSGRVSTVAASAPLMASSTSAA
jgi:hypothetical protein